MTNNLHTLVRCNMCDSLYFDPTIDELSEDISYPDLEWQQDKDGHYWGCPKCKTDDYLMDIEESENDQI